MENEEDLQAFAEEFVTGKPRETERMAMTDDELTALVRDEMSMIETDSWDLLSTQRISSTLQYSHVLGADFRSSDGLSNVVFNITNPTANTLSTYMTNIFCSDKDTVEFNPTNPNAWQMAEQVSKMVNTVIFRKNPGYKILSSCFLDAAVNKNSVLKITWQEETSAFEEMWENISPEQLDIILQEKESQGYECEITEQSETTVEEMILEPDPVTGEMVEVESSSTMVDVTIRCSYTEGMPVLECLPPEEFMINEGAVSINDSHKTRFVGHRRLLYSSEIKEMFPEVDVESLPSDTELQFDYETQARHYNDGTYDSFSSDNGQEPTKTKELVESWVRADRNGDGIAEWRHVFTCGQELLMDEEWFGDLPFASFSYFPLPHKFYGLSVYDKVRDYERSATAALRSTVDHYVMSNTNRIIADPRFVNARDLQTVKNGIIRAQPGFESKHVLPLQVSGSDKNVGDIIQIIRQQVISEIGIDPVNGQISTDIEKSGNDAAKTAMVVENASAKIESYAREFADGTLRDIIWQIVVLLVNHSDSPFVQKLVESVTPGQPFMLSDNGMYNALNKSDLSAKVGLGHMTGQQKIAGAQTMLQVLQGFAQDPNAPFSLPASAKWNILSDMAEGFGHTTPEMLLGTQQEAMAESQKIEGMKQQQLQLQQQQVATQQQQVQAQQQQAQMQFQMQQQIEQFRQQLEMMKAQAVIELDQAKTTKTQAETDKIDTETELAIGGQVSEVKVNL